MNPTTINISDLQKRNPLIDNLLAFKVLTLLSTPFEEFEAYKLGIIDNRGTVLKPYNSLIKASEKAAANYLIRMVITMKKMLSKIPDGEWYMKNMTRALFLIREHYYNETEIGEQDLILEFLNISDKNMLKEELEVMEFLNDRAT